jgi:hypothetical protein
MTIKFKETSKPEKKTYIFEKKPAKGGTPDIENKFIAKVKAING